MVSELNMHQQYINENSNFNYAMDMGSYPIVCTPPSSEEDSKPPIFYDTENGLIHQNFEQDGVMTLYMPNTNHQEGTNMPKLVIKEEPVERFRFRYKSEMSGTHGSLNGISNDRVKTFPTVELLNFNKEAIIRCTLYQHNAIHMRNKLMPHAHRLIKKYGAEEKDDPHDITVSPTNGYVASFHSMGIIHTAKKNIVPELIRKKIILKKEEIARREGKYRNLKIHEEVEIKGCAEEESKSINLNIVCLRFDAFIKTYNNILKPICEPVFSHGINNLKSALTGELKIVRMDHCTSPSTGNREIFILVEKVTKKNIKIRFFEIDEDDNEIWEGYGKFSDLDVHHQYAIVFKTPPYKDKNITEKVKIYIELVRPSDNARSEPKEFIYTPSEIVGNKRLRSSSYNTSYNSDYSSGDLPETINNFAETFSDMSFTNNVVNSEELNKAIANVNSDEFDKLYQSIEREYRSICVSTTFDSPASNNSDVLQQQKLLKTSRIDKAQVDALKRVYNEVLSVTLSGRSDKIQHVHRLLDNYFGSRRSDEVPYNAFHLAISMDNLKLVLFFLQIFMKYKRSDLLNSVNEETKESSLHVAVLTGNEDILKKLMELRPNVMIKNNVGNTPLHLAATQENDKLARLILNHWNVKTLIDEENNEGNTALLIAIIHERYNIVKLLCEMGADVNKQHKKDGLTYLHHAIVKQNLDIVTYLLEHTNADHRLRDFSDLTPLDSARALRETDNRTSCDILNIVKKYVEIHDGPTNIVIKQEMENASSDEEMESDYIEIKKEDITPEDLKPLYASISLASDKWNKCLKNISRMLDGSGTWRYLAELLDLGHLLKTNLFSKDGSPSEILLKLTTKDGESMYEIRNFLENLGETEAVKEMDMMIN